MTTKRGLASPRVHSALLTTRRRRDQLSRVDQRKSLKRRAGWPVLVASSSASLVATTLIGRLSDRHPIRRTVLIVAALSGLVSMSMNAFVRDYWLLLVSTATANALAMCLYPQTFAYGHQVLTANAPHRLAIGISTLRTVFSAAWVAGPSLGAFLLGPHGNHFTYVYAMSTGMYALAALVAIFRLREVGTLGKRSAQVAKPDVHKAAEPAVSTAAGPGVRGAAEPAASPVTAAPVTVAPEVPWSTLLLTAAGFTLLQAPMTLAVQALSLFLRDDLGVSVRDAGVVLGTCAALEVPLMLGLGTLASRIPLRIPVLAGSVCGVVYYTAVALASSTWMLIGAQVFNATFIASVSGLGISYMQAMRPAHPGQATTLFTNTFPIGALLAYEIGVARWSAELPYGALSTGEPGWPLVFAAYGVMALIMVALYARQGLAHDRQTAESEH